MPIQHFSASLQPAIFVWLVQSVTIHDFTVASRRKNYCDTVNSSYCSDVLNMFLIVFTLICCIIFVLLFLWGKNKCLHFCRHTLTSWRVTSATHIDPTLLLFLEDCEVVYCIFQREVFTSGILRWLTCGIRSEVDKSSRYDCWDMSNVSSSPL